MADFLFQGPNALTMDAKGRIAMPARHRSLLDEIKVTQLTITKHPDGALLIFPKPAWEQFRQTIMALPASATPWKRLFLGGATEVEIDASSRLLIAPELRAFGGLNRDLLMLGMGDRLELWDAQRHAEHEAKTMASPMPAALESAIF